MPDRLNKFTERARRSLQFAQEEAQRFGHNYIGTEHLLLGLLRDDDGVAARALANLGVELDRARGAVESMIGRGDRAVVGQIGLTPRAKKVLELSVDEARRLNHHFIGPEHLLLGLVREGEGIAAKVLESLDASLGKVQSELMYALGMRTGPHGIVGITRMRTSGELVWSGLAADAVRATEEATITARWFFHPEVTTAHLLVGLLREPAGMAGQALRVAGVYLEPAVAELERIAPRREPAAAGDPVLSAGTRQVLERAAQEAERRGAAATGTEHLLVGLLAQPDEEPAWQILSGLETSMTAVRAALDRLQGGRDPS